MSNKPTDLNMTEILTLMVLIQNKGPWKYMETHLADMPDIRLLTPTKGIFEVLEAATKVVAYQHPAGYYTKCWFTSTFGTVVLEEDNHMGTATLYQDGWGFAHGRSTAAYREDARDVTEFLQFSRDQLIKLKAAVLGYAKNITECAFADEENHQWHLSQKVTA